MLLFVEKRRLSMKDNAVVYFYGEMGENFSRLSEFCTKNDMFFFSCTTLDELMYLLLSTKATFIVVDCDAKATHKDLEELADIKKFYYLDTSYSGLKKNITVLSDMDSVISKIRLNNIQTDKEMEDEKRFCYKVVNSELNKLYFRNKLAGTLYIVDMVYEGYKTKIKNLRIGVLLSKVAEYYDSTSTKVERSIRFAIQSAYDSCEDKQLFFNISKSKKAPSVKELVAYLLDKVVYGDNE